MNLNVDGFTGLATMTTSDVLTSMSLANSNCNLNVHWSIECLGYKELATQYKISQISSYFRIKAFSIIFDELVMLFYIIRILIG